MEQFTTGRVSGGNLITCPNCNGLGWRIGAGASETSSAKCNVCGGTGTVPYRQPNKHYCPECADLKRQLAEAEGKLEEAFHEGYGFGIGSKCSINEAWKLSEFNPTPPQEVGE